MKLYFFQIAPNPTKVRLYLAEKAEAGCAIPLEEVVVNLVEGEQNSDTHLARNPFGKLEFLDDYENLARWDAFCRERPAAKAVLVM
jgi:glutathione S-transferase